MFDSIVIGSGFAGAVVARELAEKKGQQVCLPFVFLHRQQT